jgi:hypothetical protein
MEASQVNTLGTRPHIPECCLAATNPGSCSIRSTSCSGLPLRSARSISATAHRGRRRLEMGLRNGQRRYRRILRRRPPASFGVPTTMPRYWVSPHHSDRSGMDGHQRHAPALDSNFQIFNPTRGHSPSDANGARVDKTELLRKYYLIYFARMAHCQAVPHGQMTSPTGSTSNV